MQHRFVIVVPRELSAAINFSASTPASVWRPAPSVNAAAGFVILPRRSRKTDHAHDLDSTPAQARAQEGEGSCAEDCQGSLPALRSAMHLGRRQRLVPAARTLRTDAGGQE